MKEQPNPVWVAIGFAVVVWALVAIVAGGAV